MTGEPDLERKYRRLLWCYPRSFRRENGPEILAVLLASAADGQRRPGLGESADLIRSGLWMRLRPALPQSAPTVRAAVRFLCAGAAINTLYLVIALAASRDLAAYHLTWLGHHLTPAEISHVRPLIITVVAAFALAVIAGWLWLARAVGRGRNWARILATVLFGLTTAELAGSHSIAHVLWTGPVWLAGAAAVWLLWRPASTAFFTARHPA